MLKKAIYTLTILLMSLFILSPSQIYAIYEEGAQQGEYTDDMIYTTEIIEEDPEGNLENYEYDWDSLMNDAETVDEYVATDTLSDEEAAAVAMLSALFGGAMLIVMIVMMIASYIYTSLTLMVTAKKLNVENSWLAWVPIANLYIANKSAGLSAWMMLLMIVPFVNIGYSVYLYMMMAQRRGFASWIGILILVPFVGVIIPGYIAWAEPKKENVQVTA